MKKLIFIPLCLFPFISKSQVNQNIKLPIDSQTKKITYSEKIFIKGANTSVLYSKAKIWFDKTFYSATGDVYTNYIQDIGMITSKNYLEINIGLPNSEKVTKRVMHYTVSITLKDGVGIFEMSDFHFASSIAFWVKDSSIESIYKKNSQDGATKQYYYKIDSIAKVYKTSFENFIGPYVTNSVSQEAQSNAETKRNMKDAGRLISQSGKINKAVLITALVATPAIILTAGYGFPMVVLGLVVLEGVIIIVEEFRAANCLIRAGNLMSEAP